MSIGPLAFPFSPPGVSNIRDLEHNFIEVTSLSGHGQEIAGNGQSLLVLT